jgi:hypothetical protein
VVLREKNVVLFSSILNLQGPLPWMIHEVKVRDPVLRLNYRFYSPMRSLRTSLFFECLNFYDAIIFVLIVNKMMSLSCDAIKKPADLRTNVLSV